MIAELSPIFLLDKRWKNSASSVFQKVNYSVSCISTFLLFPTEAEEAQSKIEELKDQEYNERRSALLNANDIEMNELVRQRQEHLKEFEQNWNEHEK